MGTERTRWQTELQERLTQAADAKDSAGKRLSTFCMRSSPKSSIEAILFGLLLPDLSFAFDIFISDGTKGLIEIAIAIARAQNCLRADTRANS